MLTMRDDRSPSDISTPTAKGYHSNLTLKGCNSMSGNRKKLSLGNRKSSKEFVENTNTTVAVAKGESIEDNLEQLLVAAKDETQSPTVRLKSTDATYNVRGDRVILIRRNPFAMNGEYEPAEKYANEKALTQWVNAGVGDQFPDDQRIHAERDLVRTINEKSRHKNKESRNAWSKYKSALDIFTDEVQHEHSEDSREYRKAKWQLSSYERDVDMLHEASAMDRLARLTHALQDKIIKTEWGIKSARSAQLLALLDSLPMNQWSLIPKDLKTELAVATTNMTGTSDLMVKKIINVEIDWDEAESTETLFTWKRILWTASKII